MRLARLQTTLVEIEALKPLGHEAVGRWFSRLEATLVDEIVSHAGTDEAGQLALYLKSVRELRAHIKTMLGAERRTLDDLEKLR